MFESCGTLSVIIILLMIEKDNFICREDFIFMFKILLIVISFLLVFVDIALAEDEILDSAYFIDEVHCTGPRFNNSDQTMSLDEVDFQKDKNIQECEKLFAMFDVQKFKWISKSDIEILSRKIKHSDFFESSDLTLKKSELKNHVHLFLDAKYKEGFNYSLSSDLTYFVPIDITTNLSVSSDSSDYRNIQYETRKQKYAISNITNFEMTNNNNFPVSSSTYGINTIMMISNIPFNDSEIARKSNSECRSNRCSYTVCTNDLKTHLSADSSYSYSTLDSIKSSKFGIQPYYVYKQNFSKNINQIVELNLLSESRAGYGVEF